MTTSNLLALTAALAVASACKQAATEPAPSPPQQAPAAGSAGPPAPAASADYITVLADHAPAKKPTDPVNVSFEKFSVTRASFSDPSNLEGGTATIEVDLASLQTGSGKRDKHLATADYLDTKQFTTMTIDVGNVKKQADRHYTADATVKLRGIEKTYPVTFEVVDAHDTWVKVKGEHKFSRLDFGVGKQNVGPGEAVATDLTVKLQLTLRKS